MTQINLAKGIDQTTRMPKVSKKAGASLLVEAAPGGIERMEEAGPSGSESWEADPLKPQFAPLNAFEQSGKKIEFRRVITLSSRLSM